MAYRYIIAYKPFNILCARRDHLGRETLVDLGIPYGVQPVGRLDRDSEGLLLLTDDGATLHRLTHPNFNHPKTYLVLVLGHLNAAALRLLRQGVEIKTGLTRPADVTVLHTSPHLPAFPQPLPASEKTSWLRMVLYEGKNRQIKRMTAAVGHPTVRLARVAIGPLPWPHDVNLGAWRDLTVLERKVLLDWVWPHGRRTQAQRNPSAELKRARHYKRTRRRNR